MSKVLGFVEISQLADDSATSDPFLCQLLLEDTSDHKSTGGSDEFKQLFAFVEREIHLGDVVEATGYPEKTQRGRVSVHLQTMKTISRCTFSGFIHVSRRLGLKTSHLQGGTFAQESNSMQANFDKNIANLCEQWSSRTHQQKYPVRLPSWQLSRCANGRYAAQNALKRIARYVMNRMIMRKAAFTDWCHVAKLFWEQSTIQTIHSTTRKASAYEPVSLLAG